MQSCKLRITERNSRSQTTIILANLTMELNRQKSKKNINLTNKDIGLTDVEGHAEHPREPQFEEPWASGSEVDEVPESVYASSIVLSSQQPPLEEPFVLPSLMPTSSIPADTNDTSYDISVPPLFGSTITPYFDLATGISHQVVPTLPSVQLYWEHLSVGYKTRKGF